MKRRVVNFSPGSGPIAQVQDGTANIFMFGDISEWWGVNKDTVTAALKGKSYENVNVYISSPGGDIAEAFTIHDLLRGTRANVTAYLTGTCASAATVIACSANRVVMSQACVYMIHKPLWGNTWGNADSLRKDADILDIYESIILNIYATKTGKSKRALKEMVAAETWMEPADAMALGFVDEVVDSIEIDWTVPTSGLSSGWDSWLWDNADATNKFTGIAAKRSAVINLIEKGYRQYEPEADSQNKNFTIMNFAQKVIAFLLGQNFIAQENAEAAQNALMGMDLVEAVQAAAEEKFAKVTQADVLAAINALTPEQRSQLFPRNDAEETAAGEAATDTTETDTRITELQEQIAGLQEQLAQVQNTTAGLASKKTVPVAPTNGKQRLSEEEAETQMPIAQIQMALKGLDKKQINTATFQSITGMTPEAARAHVAAHN